MATLNIPNTFVDGEVAEASEVNGNFTAVKQFAEGLSDGTNIDAGAVTAAKLASNSVVEAKIASGAVTVPKLAAAVFSSDQMILGNQVFG